MLKPSFWTALSASTVLVGCASVTPVALTPNEISSRAKTDVSKLYQKQEPIAAPLTFYDAVARALSYNLDFRLKMMESALAKGISDTSTYDLLPKLTTQAGYTRRNTDSGGTSIGIEDRLVSVRPSTSEERDHQLASAELSWNILDFGISYYRAKQAGEDYNIAEERRRKVQQNIVQDLRNAYWRALGAQRLLGQAQALNQRIEVALEQSREAEASGVLPPAQALAYQRALMDAMSLITAKRQELDFAKLELSALMNVPASTSFTLVDMPEEELPQLPHNIAQLEMIALENRPELREEDYNTRKDGWEAKKQMIAMLPGVGLTAGINYDSNQYLYNNNWYDASLRMTWDIFKLASYPTVQKTQKARAETAEARRLALTMAVLTQVRVSIERYKLALLDFKQIDESARVDERLAQIGRAGVSSRVDTELEAVRTESRALVSQFQRYAAYANAQAAYGRIYNSLGKNVLPKEVPDRSIAELSKALHSTLEESKKGTFTFVSAKAVKPQPVRVEVAPLPAGLSSELVRKAVSERLGRSQINIVSLPTKSAVFKMKLERGVVKNGVERAQWIMTLVDASGRSVANHAYATTLTPDLPARSIQAFAEAAALSQVTYLRKQLALGESEKK